VISDVESLDYGTVVLHSNESLVGLLS